MKFLFLSFLVLLTIFPLAAESSPSGFALGINYIGGQARYNLNSLWAGELRYLTGSEDASTGKITSQVFGLRGYRFFRESTYHRFFLGSEAALVNSNQKNTSYKVSGPAVGAFGGVGIPLWQEIFLGA